MNIENLPYSEACERNKDPILKVLKQDFADDKPLKILELGSGTGQHGAFFAEHLPQVQWQLGDVEQHLGHLRLRQEHSGLPNLLPPKVLDAFAPSWDLDCLFDRIFTANTFHIVSPAGVKLLIQRATQFMKASGHFLVYGPFNYEGKFTSPSNERFHYYLREQDPLMGIRDREEVR